MLSVSVALSSLEGFGFILGSPGKTSEAGNGDVRSKIGLDKELFVDWLSGNEQSGQRVPGPSPILTLIEKEDPTG